MDGQLVERARAGDADAFDQLVRERLDPVYRLALGILGEAADARDATQEAFVAAWRKLPSLREPAKFDAWLDQITVNACRMALRKRRGVRELRLMPEADLPAADRSAARNSPKSDRSMSTGWPWRLPFTGRTTGAASAR